MAKGILNLTPEQAHFWKMLRVRVTHKDIGQPFLSYLFFSLIPVNIPGTKTMGVDKFGRCYIDFDHFMDENAKHGGLAEATKVLNHEPWHLLLNHHARADALPAFDPATKQMKNHLAWNHAGDLNINQMIRDRVPDWGVHVGEEGSYKNYPKNLITEKYYEMIMKNLPEQCPTCGAPQSGDKDKSQDKSDDGQGGESGDSGENQDGSESGDGSDSGSGDGPDGSESGAGDGGQGQPGQGGQPGSGSGHSCGDCGSETGSGEASAGDCGSGAGGQPKDWELGPEGGLSDYDIDGLRRQTAEEIKKQEQGKPGSVPGAMKVWAEETLAPPTVDWRTVLRGEVKAAVSWKEGKMDYNRQRRSRRNPNQNIIMPALRTPKARITIGTDVSGSNVGNLNTVLSNAVAISKHAGVKGRDLTAFAVDVEASDPTFVNNPLDLFKNVRGGGGTDMRVAFKVFENLARRKATDICILATDLETGWPAEPPRKTVRYIVLGVMNTNDRNSPYEKEARKALAGWAKLICVYPDELEG